MRQRRSIIARLRGAGRSVLVPTRDGWCGRLAFFGKSGGGAVAVEFALVSIPFMMLMMAIIEMALSFFVSGILDTATTSASRLIRTGEAYQTSMTASQFQQEVCDGMFSLVDCTDNLVVDVQAYGTFSAYQPTSPLDSSGNLLATHFTNGGTDQPIIVVRAFYKWPIYFNMLAYSGYVIDNHVLIGAVSAFRVEPFS